MNHSSAAAGKADKDGDGYLWLGGLEAHVKERVAELTGGEQTPVVTYPGGESLNLRMFVAR